MWTPILMVMFTATVISQVLLLTKTFTPMMAASLEVRTKLKEGRDLLGLTINLQLKKLPLSLLIKVHLP